MILTVIQARLHRDVHGDGGRATAGAKVPVERDEGRLAAGLSASDG
jgi:hypothetical protein